MSMSKRLQIPISEVEENLVRKAAKAQSLSMAEWARNILTKSAQESLSNKIDSRQALELLFSLNGSIADVQTMKDQSTKNRYK